MLKMMVNIHEA